MVLHGLLGSARNWTSIARQLGESFRVFALDLRNHGRSPWAATMALDEMAADVAAFIERHELRAATVLGHSLGGKVAMRLALTRPELAARLVVVDVAPVAYEHGFAGYIEALRRSIRRACSAAPTPMARCGAAIPDPGIRSFLLQNLVPSGGSFAWRVNLAALAGNMATMMGFPDRAGGRLPRAGAVPVRRALGLRQAGAPAADRGAVPKGHLRGDRGRRPLGPRRAPGRVPGERCGAFSPPVEGRRMPGQAVR